MKSPPKQIADDDAHDGVERFIEETRPRPRQHRRRQAHRTALVAREVLRLAATRLDRGMSSASAW